MTLIIDVINLQVSMTVQSILAQIKALELKIISTGFHNIMMMYTTPSKFSSDTVPDKTKLDTSTCLLISD